MQTIHAIWTGGTLHLFGERAYFALGKDAVDSANENGGARSPYSVSSEALRRKLGDVFDSLLISDAQTSRIALQLPHVNGRPLASTAELAAEDGATKPTLSLCEVETLAFQPADSIDLLTAQFPSGSEAIQPGDSVRFWSTVARLVLELLATQRFVPAIHHMGEERFRGFWRVVVNDRSTSQRLGGLINSMPPVCRAAPDDQAAGDAAALVENFLWTTVDALVRRCLEGDELAHSIQDMPAEECSDEMLWLRSLVCADAQLAGDPVARRSIKLKIDGWLGALEVPVSERPCRTCFQLHSPPADESDAASEAPEWKLTLHVQATARPELVLDAESLVGNGGGEDPRILERPFDHAKEQLRADVAKAARHFPPLLPCAEPDGPVGCTLTIAEAYTFLRDAAPVLETEGFGIWLPEWWRRDRSRLRMWLDLQPLDEAPESGQTPVGLDTIVGYDWRLAIGDEDIDFDEIRRIVADKAPLVRVRGRWVEMHVSEMTTALDFVEQNRAGRMTVLEALRHTYAAEDRETGIPLAGLRVHGWLKPLLGAADGGASMEHLSPPPGFVGELRPYQLRGLDWLSFLTKFGLGACLADDMGLGKTIQLIALLLHERKSGQSPGPTLLVVPMSLVGNWHREIAKFGPQLNAMIHHGTERLTGSQFVDEVARHDVVISTYGLIHRDLEHLAAVDWLRISLDEAQNIKNPVAKQTVAIRKLRSVHRIALTGTPIENRLSELWSIMDFLNAGYLSTAAEFRRRFAVPIERHHDQDRAERLRHLIRPFILRRLKSDPKVEIDLPAKMEMKVYCNLTREQAALYQALVDEMMGQIGRSDGIQRRGLILATLLKLKQVCNHPVQFLGDDTSLPHRSGKCDRITDMVEELLAEGDRAIIFTQFRQMGHLLQKMLEQRFDREVLFLHGGTPRTKRDELVARFQDMNDDSPLLLLSLKAGGYGLNLTAASHVFHFDRWWNPAVEDQATDRAHRIGQDKRVQVHKFVCIGTLEERIDALLDRKRDLAANIVGEGEQWLTEMTTHKLREMFALSSEAVADD